MKINWKVRVRNRAWLGSMAAAVITFVYALLDLLGLCPSMTEDTAMKIVNALLFVLAALGIVIDPTTTGLSDSQRALGYNEPWADE